MKVFGHNVQTSLPIFVADLSEMQELDQARKAVDELRKAYPTIESNVKSVYTSPFDSHTKNENLLPLSRLVCKAASFLTENAMGQRLEFEIMNCWVSVYERGDHTISHNHWPSLFSVVVYLEADDNSSPLVFENQIPIKVQKNQMVMFPGWILHNVPKTESSRIIVAYNLTAVFDIKKTY
jgi:hypothetical protein